MLSSIFISDIVLIKKLELQFQQGLSVLSGETGAGKSILLDSLSLALGARGDGKLVRLGCQQGQVAATFNLAKTHKINELLKSHELPINDELILKRIQSKDGPTKSYINDNPVSVNLLAEVGNYLVEIHGQHDERAFIDPAGHRQLVDIFGKLETEVNKLAGLHGEWRQAKSELAKTQKRVAEMAKDAEYLASSVAELKQLNAQTGEEEDLAARRKLMMESETIVSEISSAISNLSNARSPAELIKKVVQQLEVKASNILRPAIEHLYQARDSLAKAEDELQKSLAQCNFEPNELEQSEERLFELRAASRKYRVAVENLPAHCQKLSEDLAMLESGEENLQKLEQLVQEKYALLEKAASKLTSERKKAGEKLQSEVMQQLPFLKLENAEFYLHFETTNEITASGADNIEFYVRTNKSTRAGPMMKIASGGELSRFLLALKVVLADCSSACCLIFDEIDTGAGGAVADAIGSRLQDLSKNVQVLSITHAPQVAARAFEHFLIAKIGESKQQQTSVQILDEQQRKEEIARMISGAKISDAARDAAKHLLSQG